MRFLIGNYLTGNNCSFENVHKIVPDIHGNPNRCSEVDRPRFIKSHSYYKSLYPNVVYIVRDGRDVAVSYYHYNVKQGDIQPNMSFSKFLRAFNQGDIDPFGVWGEHVLKWIRKTSGDDLLLVQYEDMLEDSSRELKRVLSFVGMEIQDKAVNQASEASSFDNMRESEKAHHDKALGLDDSDSSRRFIRKGERGDWRNFFNEYCHERFLRVHGEALRRMGYPTSGALKN